MYILQEYFFVISAFNSLFLAGLLLSNKRPNSASYTLAIWCIGLAYYVITPLVLSKATSTFLIYVFIWGAYIPACFGVFMYLYMRTSITMQPLKSSDSLHFLPLLICLALNSKVITYSQEELLLLMETGSPQGVLNTLTLFVVYSQAAIYLVRSGLLLARFNRQASDNLSDFNPQIFSHLLIILVLNSLIWLLELASKLFGGVDSMALISDLFFVLFILLLSLFHWYNPRRFQIAALHDVVQKESTNNKEQGNVPSSTRGLMLEQVNRLMENQQPFLNNGITLSDLAEMLSISAHHLSETLNKEAGKNFYQYVNEYRVKYFCELLKTAPKEKRVLDLAMASGFSSKSTFNLVFKQIKGMTPSQFKSEIHKHN